MKNLIFVFLLFFFAVEATVVKCDPPEKRSTIKNEKTRGGELYEQYATAMHNKRTPKEMTPAQWKTVLLQKRIRIPLTAEDHRDLLQFFDLKEQPL